MAPRVEIILLKQLASCLAMPMFVVDPDGGLIFFNESVEVILGRRFEEVGALGSDELPLALQMTDQTGSVLKNEDRPIVRALELRAPVHNRLRIRGFDAAQRTIEGTGIPLIALDGSLLGALGLFWELGAEALESDGADPGNGQHALEVILMRRLADHLAVPILIVDDGGRLVHFNAPVESVVGRPFRELASARLPELFATFEPSREDGTPLPLEEHPISIARLRHEPAHRRFYIRTHDGVARGIEATAIPLIGQSSRRLGAVGFFWELGTA